MTTSNIRVYTNNGESNGVTSAQGTKVFVGDTELRMITALELVADVGGVWTLKLSVPVDPAKVFSPLPEKG